MNTITPGWMAAYGTGIRVGRDFDDRDTLTAPRVMLVNEAFVRRFAAGRDVVGTTLALAQRISPSSDFPMGSKTILGVVGDTVSRSIREPQGPAIYLPLSQWEFPTPPVHVLHRRPVVGLSGIGGAHGGTSAPSDR